MIWWLKLTFMIKTYSNSSHFHSYLTSLGITKCMRVCYRKMCLIWSTILATTRIKDYFVMRARLSANCCILTTQPSESRCRLWLIKCMNSLLTLSSEVYSGRSIIGCILKCWLFWKPLFAFIASYLNIAHLSPSWLIYWPPCLLLSHSLNMPSMHSIYWLHSRMNLICSKNLLIHRFSTSYCENSTWIVLHLTSMLLSLMLNSWISTSLCALYLPTSLKCLLFSTISVLASAV